jgi:hypothetical protein
MPTSTSRTAPVLQTYELAPPTVTAIDTVDGSPNNLSTEHFSVTFSTAVHGVDASDFTLVGTGTASGAVGSVSGSGTTWTVTANNVTGDGALRLDLNNAGDAITDNFGITLTATHTGDQSYTIQHTPPAVTSVSGERDLYRGTRPRLHHDVQRSRHRHRHAANRGVPDHRRNG